MIFVIAQLQLHRGMRDAFLSEFVRILPLVHAEQGCLAYVPTIDAQTGIGSQALAGEDCVTVVEQWVSLAALKAHDAAEHMQLLRARTKSMVAHRTIRMLTAASEAQAPVGLSAIAPSPIGSKDTH